MSKPNDIKSKPYYRYAKSVIDGDIVAGELIRLACKRFMSDLERPDLEFRPEIGDKFIKFCGLFKHFKGRSAGQTFILENWQEFIAYNILCFFWKGTNRRRFTNSFICISRKQGKTAFAALFCLWFLIMDGEGSPEVDLAANSRSQAQIAYDFVKQFSKQIDPKQKDLKILRNSIQFDANVGKINVFAADSSKLDGFNASFALVDEMGAAKDSKMYDVLKSSMGQRLNPHLMIISTVGFDLSSVFYRMYKTNCEILHCIKSDDSTFIAIYALDEGDDYTDEKNWLKFAPNLNVTVDAAYLRDQLTAIKNNASMEVGVLTKNFNKWCSTASTWISSEYINKVTQTVNLDEFSDDTIAFAAVDLAATSDLTCLSLLLEKNDKLYFKNFYYLPESALTDSPNREFYRYLQRTKQLTVTEGNVTDYQYVLNDLMKLYSRFSMRKIGYDQWNATQFIIAATENGLPMEPVSQSFGSLSRPTKTLERLIKKGDVIIDNSELNRYCFGNVTLKSDWNENVKAVKGGGKDGKIDGVIAIIMALSCYLDTPKFTGSIFSV